MKFEIIQDSNWNYIYKYKYCLFVCFNKAPK